MMVDMALRPHLSGHIALYDINLAAARRNARGGGDIFARKEALNGFSVSPRRTLPVALRGSDAVVIAIQPGPTSMTATAISWRGQDLMPTLRAHTRGGASSTTGRQ